MYGLQFRPLGKKKRLLMEVIDFILIRGQQSFEDKTKVNPIEVKIENDKIQNLFEIYRKTVRNLSLKVCRFQARLKMKKIFLTTSSVFDTKYRLINAIKLYQTIGVINLIEIKN